MQEKWGKINWVNDHKGIAAIEVGLQADWHIFWQHPGAVGLPVKVTVSQKEQSEELTNFWPTPMRFKVGPLEGWGYEGDVVIPMAFPGWIDLKSSYKVEIFGQVCKEVCIPFEHEAIIKPSETAQNIKGLQNLPQFHKDDVKLTAVFEKDKNHRDLALMEVIIEQEAPFISPSIFEANLVNLSYSLQDLSLISQNKARFLMKVEGLEFQPDELSKGELSFLITDRNKAYYINAKAEEGKISEINRPKIPLWIILQALLVGLIFNVMPCVLPVLGIKLGTVVGLSGKKRAEVRLRFSLTALGILIAFGLLAVFLSFAQSLGAYVGWGVHFQQPLFIAFMMMTISIFAASVFGFWSLRQPSVTTKSTETSILGEIGSGILATILATPCTAPFMAPVAAFAFAGSSLQLFVVFLCIGLGMATPWLVIALFPSLVSFLPKPGKWMNYVKLFLGILLICTLLWLNWVLWGQVHFYGAIAIGLACLFILIVLGLGRKATGVMASVKWIFVLGLCLMITNMAIVVETYERSKEDKVRLDGVATIDKGGLQGIAYSEAKKDELLEQGQDVLVIGTAEWCITCKVNERITFKDKNVVDILAEKNTAILIADMTSENKEGEAWLSSLNRYGLPLTVFYRAGGEVKILPTFVKKEDIFNLFP